MSRKRLVRLTPEQRTIVKEWALQFAAVGTTRAMAERMGVEQAAVQYYVRLAERRLARLRKTVT